jgi:hemoglobin
MQFEFPEVHDRGERDAIESAISRCVRAFYAKGASDPLIGPVFAKIPDLEHHLGIIENFWSKSLLRTQRYEGLPFAVHTKLPIEPQHFARWLELFTETAREHLPSTQAEQAIAKASHMTQCFQSGLFPFTDAEGKPSRVP